MFLTSQQIHVVTPLDEMALTMGHKILFSEKYGYLHQNYLCYPFLSGALFANAYW